MISSKTISQVYSNVENNYIYSEVIDDYRTVDEVLRKTEELELRITENTELRQLES